MINNNKSAISQVDELVEKVIEKDYCIGCGACAVVPNSPFKVEMNQFGNMVAVKKGSSPDEDCNVLEVCPFSGHSKNEDEISDLVFPKADKKEKHIGKYLACYAGYVKTDDFRTKGSSGGMGKWLGSRLLIENKIDYFVQVVPNDTDKSAEPLFKYKVFTDAKEVVKGSKSSYYPVTLVDVIDLIRNQEGRYAVTGVPCFIKTLRLLGNSDDVIKNRLLFTIGIVCGGMKSANQSKIIGWQLGVKPENLIAIDFRRKHKDRPASNKIYEVWSNIDKAEKYKDSAEIFGTDWSGYFRPNACDYCDDVVAETADISIGDAWLPEYIQDPKGTNVAVVRNKEILDLLIKNNKEEQIHLEEISAEQVAQSQAGGFRQRREALSYRIEKKEQSGEWFPPKRVSANDYNVTKKRRKIYGLREQIAHFSHIYADEALKQNNLNLFIDKMKPIEKRYFIANKGRLPKRFVDRVIRKFKKVFKVK